MKQSPQAQGNARTQPVRIEPRWPVACTVLAVLFLLTLLRSRARLFPFWLAYAIAMALLLPMAGVWLSGARVWWLRLERITTLCSSLMVEIITLRNVWFLVLEIVERPMSLSGRQLLTSSIAAWVANILAFSLVYWQIDRG